MLDFGWKDFKMFGRDGPTFERRWIFIYREDDEIAVFP